MDNDCDCELILILALIAAGVVAFMVAMGWAFVEVFNAGLNG